MARAGQCWYSKVINIGELNIIVLIIATIHRVKCHFCPADCLGSKVFSLIKSDINGNITVRERESVSASEWLCKCVCLWDWWCVCTDKCTVECALVWLRWMRVNHVNCDIMKVFFGCCVCSHRKLKKCTWRTRTGTSPCSISWSPSGETSAPNGPKWERRWLSCGSRGEAADTTLGTTNHLEHVFKKPQKNQQYDLLGVCFCPKGDSVSSKSCCRV